MDEKIIAFYRLLARHHLFQLFFRHKSDRVAPLKIVSPGFDFLDTMYIKGVPSAPPLIYVASGAKKGCEVNQFLYISSSCLQKFQVSPASSTSFAKYVASFL